MATRKTIAKADGLKSTFYLEPEHLFMTSFGKGMHAKSEKDIQDRTVTNLNNTFTASVPVDSNWISINGKAGQCQVAEPKLQDQLHAKEIIESIYFGKEYSDNIHIQLAYNIMDIQKILAAYSGIVIYTVNRMNRDSDDKDFLGEFKTQNSYDMTRTISKAYKLRLLDKNRNGKGFFINGNVWRDNRNGELKWLNRQVNIYKQKKFPDQHWNYAIISDFLCSRGIHNMKILKKTYDCWNDFCTFCKSAKDSAYYFGNTFCDEKGNFDERKTFTLLRLLGTFRQDFIHGEQLGGSSLFRPAEKWPDDVTAMLNSLLDGRIENLNKNFCSQNRVNIRILEKIYPDISTKQLVREYYNFLIRKSFKNIGFSVRTLRETILAQEEEAHALTEKSYDSVRGKLYSLMDFVIYKFYLDREKDIEEMVSKLRFSISDEDKERVYQAEAERLWLYIQESIMKNIVPAMTSDSIKSLSKGKADAIENIEDYMEKPGDLSAFSKAIYAFSLFLDGKEINMLLSDLVSKFENIASFLDTLRFLNMDCSFTDNFVFFKDSAEIAGDLRFIQSIARMNKGKKAKKNTEVTVKKCQYKDSAAVLGETDESKINRLYNLKSSDSETPSGDNSLRNFIINNVINNNRFTYVVRFLKPADAREIMQCRPLIAYTLQKIPQSQIERYCRAVSIPFAKDECEKAVNELTKLLINVKLDNFVSVKQKASSGSKEAVQKEKYKAVISLYLTVLYLIVKTLVRINSRYMIAFGILERDLALYRIKTGDESFRISDKVKSETVNARPERLTLYFRENYKLNPRVAVSCETNAGSFSKNVFKVYRNKVAHLQTVTLLPAYIKEVGIGKVKSMFDVYHCVLLYGISETDFHDETLNAALKDNLEKCKEYCTACKDFIYALNIPFAYNAARYINLSNREKFIESYGK